MREFINENWKTKLNIKGKEDQNYTVSLSDFRLRWSKFDILEKENKKGKLSQFIVIKPNSGTVKTFSKLINCDVYLIRLQDANY